MKRAHIALLAFALALPIAAVHADTFGSGTNIFTIDFVTIGNPGNGNDAGAGGGTSSSPAGAVPYRFRMGVFEISQAQLDAATASGLINFATGFWSGNQPSTSMTWYEVAAFVNWLNTSTGHHAAYNLVSGGARSMNVWSAAEAWQLGGENRFRHKDAFYFLPSEDEWYKAAYHKNDGLTANYWDYPTRSNTVPDGIDTMGDATYQAVFAQGYQQPAPNLINSVGLASAYGTYGQGGNVAEWLESALDGVNDTASEYRMVRGGHWAEDEYTMRAEGIRNSFPEGESNRVGFRVASIPEPSSALLLAAAGGTLLLRRRH